MRIAYICADPGIPVFGRKGASIHVQEVIRALLRTGATVDLFTNRLGGEPPLGLENVVVHKLLPLPKGMELVEREQAALATNDQAMKILEMQGPYDLIYERYSLWSYVGMVHAEVSGVPGFLEVNAPLIAEQAKHRGLIHHTEAERVAQRNFEVATAIIAVSDGVADYVKSYPNTATRVHVISNGVDTTHFAENCKPAELPVARQFTIGFVGSLKAWHGLDVLVEAFEIVHDFAPETRLLFVGDGPEREGLTTMLAERHLLDATHFTGAIDHGQVPHWLAAMDVAVAPYPPLDNFYFSPLKVYEYMAAGCAVVASEIGQIADLIEDGENGLLCPPGNAQALASAILRLRSEEGLVPRLGQAARTTIVRNHTWDAVVEQILALVRSSYESDAFTMSKVATTDTAKSAIPQTKHRTKPQTFSEAVPGFFDILGRLRPQLAQQRWLLTGAFLAMLAVIGLRLLEPWPLKFIVDYLSGESSLSLPLWMHPLLGEGAVLTASAVGIVLLVMMRAAMSYFATVAAALAGNRVLTEVRSELYQHLLDLSLSFHTRTKSGDLLTRLIGDIGRVQEVAVTAMLPLLISIFTLVGMLGMMFWLHWQLALLSLLAFPLASLTMTRYSGRIRQAARKQRKRQSDMAAMAGEALGAIRVVKAFSLESALREHFASANQKSLKEGVQTKRLAASLERLVDIFIAMGTALVVWYGSQLVARGTLTIGDLIVFLSYLKSAFRPMSNLAKYTGRIAKAVASGERIFEVLDTQPDIQDLPDATEAPNLRGAVQFEQVSFRYLPGKMVLHDINFSIKPGQFLAIVGPSGAGKSTLSSLLLRLYDPTNGHIAIDGCDIRHYKLTSLRSQMSVVLQDSLLFGVSVRENIRYAAPEACDREIETAARQANAHDFIMALPDGYDTVLGERGATLSGGQRQRIAIARAAVRKAPILILDEPTVGLDEKNAQAVQTALRQLVTDHTTLLITHDLKMAASADLILYMEDGSICERGTHQELVALNGRYATMFALQIADKSPRFVSSTPKSKDREVERGIAREVERDALLV